MVSNRKMFIEKYIQYATSFKDKHQAGIIKKIININASCPSNIKDKAIQTICIYVTKLYWIIEQKVNKYLVPSNNCKMTTHRLIKYIKKVYVNIAQICIH